MITINLLPTKKKAPKKVTELQQQLILGSLILVLVFLGMWFYYQSLAVKIANLARSKAEAEAKIRQQDNMLKEVKTVEEERRKVTEKIAVIEQLKKNQTLLVHLLDEISKELPKGVNIVSLSESNGQINLDGIAFTNNEIVRFVDNLKGNPFMSDVFLQETVQGAQDGIEIYSYKLRFSFKGV
jgi:type IV pilus assembly protein PilN